MSSKFTSVFLVLLLVFLLSFIFYPIVSHGQTPPVEAKNTPKIVLIKQKVQTYADKYNVDPDDIYQTLDCESNHFESPAIQSRVVGPLGRELSFGYAQIHLPDHPDVTYQQAIDPDFSIDFIAKNWTKHKNWWVCTKKLGL